MITPVVIGGKSYANKVLELKQLKVFARRTNTILLLLRVFQDFKDGLTKQ